MAVAIESDKSQVSRSLAVLAEYGYVVRDSNRRYRIGWRLFTTVRSATESLYLHEVERLLERLTVEFGQRGYMLVLENQMAVTVLDVKPRPSFHETMVGVALPLYYTASGRALVLNETLAELKARLGGEQLDQTTDRAPATVEELHERLAESRERGYVVVDEEMESGLVSVAVPLGSPYGGATSSITLVGSADRFRPHLHEAGVALMAAARELNGLMGIG
jgi:DNA-binding IclR family transcriptional regulator